MKKFIHILTLLLGLTFTSFAQNKTETDQSPQAKLIKYYPNPASFIINFDYVRGYDKTYSLQIFNFMGKRVFELKNTPPRMNVNLDAFYRGIYVFQLRDKYGSIIESGKFQIIK